MVALRTDSRLRAAERRLGLSSTLGATRAESDTERAERAIGDGSATLADFAVALEDEMPLLRAWLVVRGKALAIFREAGHAIGVSPLRPDNIAADIAATPLAEAIEPDLVRDLLRAVQLAGARSDKGYPPGLLPRALAIGQSASAWLAVLGAPDGRPLRKVIAEGGLDDAEEVVAALGGDLGDPWVPDQQCVRQCPPCGHREAAW